MARGEIVAIGAILLFLGIIAFFTPIPNVGFTIPMANNLCTSDWMQFALMFSQDPESREACNIFGAMNFGIYGISLIGIILIIVGAVKKPSGYPCQYCNYFGSTESELQEHQAEKHLEKSPYVCEHCGFIGTTEKILWNHYNEKHPSYQKW